jgi:hypothetical protein
MEISQRITASDAPSVVSAERFGDSAQVPLLRRSALAERMNAVRAEGKRLTEQSTREAAGLPATSLRSSGDALE